MKLILDLTDYNGNDCGRLELSKPFHIPPQIVLRWYRPSDGKLMLGPYTLDLDDLKKAVEVLQ